MTHLQGDTDSPERRLGPRHDRRLAQGRQEFVRPVRSRGEVEGPSVERENTASWRLAETEGVGEDRVEHGLHARRRTRDDTQDFTSGGLSLEGLADLLVCFRERLVLLL
jgi:hypothetical protein